METLKILLWTDFEPTLAKLNQRRSELEAVHTRRFGPFLYRGVGSAGWHLETTLERAYPNERTSGDLTVSEYYREVYSAKPTLETLTSNRWQLAGVSDFEKRLTDTMPWDMSTAISDVPDLYEYLVYLRHHGYPSPLLDWSGSPYLAAFFTFDLVPPKEADHVCVFALLRDSLTSFGSGEPYVSVLGHFVRSDPRHYVQQSQYTVCVDRTDKGLVFAPHADGIAKGVGVNGGMFQILVPVSARLDALRHLDQMNINPYSVYGTEDALIRTVARRRRLF